MDLSRIMPPLRRACNDYKLVAAGDRIAVGVSGGKDSLVLTAALARLRRICDFGLYAVAVDLGLGADYSPVGRLCEELEVPLSVVPTEIGKIVFSERREKNPCSLCSSMRRGALKTEAERLGCNKIALGHHADDLAETFLLSAFYEGRLSVFPPMAPGSPAVIRPLIYAREKDIIHAIRGTETVKNPCPADGNTKRQYIKNLLRTIKKDIPIAADRLISALTHPERNNLWDKPGD